MRVRILLAGALESMRGELLEAIFGWVQPGMLAGEQQSRHYPAVGERSADGTELDSLRPGPDDQPYICRSQLSP
jgi:hypothetical protein